MPQIIVTEAGHGEEAKIPLSDSESRIGRAPGSEILLGGQGISREHAKILREGEHFFLVDLESGNGTFLNGHKVQSRQKILLRHHDQITILPYHLRFLEERGPFSESLREEEEKTDANILEVKLLKKVLDAVDADKQPSIEILSGTAQGQRFLLSDEEEELILGRDPVCQIHVPDEVISRQHAKIVRRWGGIALIDIESKNGTYLNNKRVQEEFLHDGDRFALGTTVFLFRNPKELNLHDLGEEIASKRKTIEAKEEARLHATASGEERGPARGTATRGSAAEAQEILKEISDLKPSPANDYPTPRESKNRLSPLEIGLLGLGVIVLCFAALTLANLLLGD